MTGPNRAAVSGSDNVVAFRGRRRMPLGAAVHSLATYLGDTGARLYMLRELIAGSIVATAALLHLEHTFLGPTPPAILHDEPVPLEFWCFEWSHDGEIATSLEDGRSQFPRRTSITSDWHGSSFAVVMTWGTPTRGLRMCKRASGVTIGKADYANLLSSFQCREEPPAVSVTQVDVVNWCADWLSSGRGRNSAEAYAHFAADPRFDDVAREAFRAAWSEAKRRKNG